MHTVQNLKDISDTVQAGLSACSQLIAAPADFSDADADMAEGLSASAAVAIAPRATYATSLALTALLRVGGRAPRPALAAALPLSQAVAVASRVQRPGVPRGRDAALEVIAVALRGAALPDIKESLPQIMALTTASGGKVRTS